MVRNFDELARERSYEITSIEPADACVGEHVAIRGTGFQFENTQTVVTFSGQAADSHVVASIVDQPTDTLITVEVPAGASCGPVQLYTEGSTVLICGEPYELFRGPLQPYRFGGGLPRFTRPIRVEGQAAGPDGILPHCVPADAPLVSWDFCGVVQHISIDATYNEEPVWSISMPPLTDVRFPVPPEKPEEALYVVTVRLTGRCGTAEATVGVPTRRPLQFPESEAPAPEFVSDRFENFHRNQIRYDIQSYTPPTRRHLRAAVVLAESERSRLGVTGSRCSYTNCVVPTGTDRMLRMDGLKRWLNKLSQGPAAANLQDGWAKPHMPDDVSLIPLETVLLPESNIASVLTPNERAAYDGVYSGLNPGSTYLPIRDRLVYVEAGMLVEELNSLLDHHAPPLALATMGAGTHQTLAGAISTGTHGSTWRLPPMSDFVRAIHLIGTDGVQWWLEPHTRPITDSAKLHTKARAGDLGLTPCTRIRYSDDLFYAALVSAGCAGIIYAYVIETVPSHHMRTAVTDGADWEEAKKRIHTEFTPGKDPDTWFLSVTTSPSRDAVIVEKWLTSQPLSKDDGTFWDDVAFWAYIKPAVEAALNSGAVLIAIEAAEAALLSIKLLGEFVPRAALDSTQYFKDVSDVGKRIAMLGDLAEALFDSLRLIFWHDNAALAKALPNIVELLWQLTPMGLTAGQEVLDQIQRQETLGFSKVPEIAKSFRALTQQIGGPPRVPPRHEAYKDTERIMRSSEYAFPLSAGIAFVDDLLNETDRLRAGDDAFILSINIRFTGPTRALIAMQQFSPLSCHVELFTMKELAGNNPLDAVVDRLVRLHGGTPHWGQLHPEDLDFGALFSWKLGRWRSAISTLADGRPTFRHAFATDRKLL
ncbi:MAG: IPT/TIG domain-containing protein [Chloroflexota bacterium]|nr:IPT/TIG domain-containing protein [Chloroflexota bacterium]